MAAAGISVWEALAGRAPGRPVGPAQRDVYEAVLERLNPAKARPVLRAGVEEAHLTSVRGQPYVMLRSPDVQAAYLRLHPEEVELAHLMDGSRSVAVLAAEFKRITGRLAPGQVVRVVADLAANRMLTELPLDAFHALEAVRRRPLPLRFGRWLLAVARGQRFPLFDVDRLAGALYRNGGRFLFTRSAAVLLAGTALLGAAVFVATWVGGAQQAFVANGSYAAGGLTLLGLNAACLVAHELGHALAAKHAGRRVPAAGILLYLGIPSVFVDTTDVWMAGRRARLLTSAAGPGASLAMAGAVNLVGLLVPAFGPLAFKLGFLWYLNALFNLNPLLALDGYYLLMDWLEIPNLRARGLVGFAAGVRHKRLGWRGLDGEDRLVAMYGTAAALWVVISVLLGVRMWKDRVSGLVAGLWFAGWPSRVGLVAFVAVLVHPLVYLCLRGGWKAARRARRRLRERRRLADEPRRLAVLLATGLRTLPPAAVQAMARQAVWVRARSGTAVVRQGSPPRGVVIVVEGMLEARRAGDPPGSVRARAEAGDLAGAATVLRGAESPVTWTASDAVLLVVPPAVFLAAAVGQADGLATDSAEAEAVLELPVFAALTETERAAMLDGMRPLDLAPGQSVALDDGQSALVVEAGVVGLADGEERRSGDVIGPSGEDSTIAARARTPARLWTVPALAGVAHLAGGAAPRPAPGRGGGVHVDGGLPLTAPWGAAPPAGDAGADDRLARWFRRLLVLLVLLALMAAGAAAPAGTAWSEIPGRRAVVAATEGSVDVTFAGRSFALRGGDRAAVGEGALLTVPEGSLAYLSFRGGARAVLCPGSSTRLGPVRSTGRDPVRPSGTLAVRSGKLVVDTRPRRSAFGVLTTHIQVGGRRITSSGPARFAVASGGIQVELGAVAADGSPVAASAGRLSCDSGGSTVAGPALPGAAVSPASPGRRLPTGGPQETGAATPPVGPAESPAVPPAAGTVPTTALQSTTSSTAPPRSTTPTTPSPPITRPTTAPTTAPPSSTAPPPPPPVPDFAVACSPSTLQGRPGQALTSSCKVTSMNGFDGSVTLQCALSSMLGTCSATPASLSPPVDGGATATLVVMVGSAAPPGCHQFRVRATSGSEVRNVLLTLDVPDSRGGSSC